MQSPGFNFQDSIKQGIVAHICNPSQKDEKFKVILGLYREFGASLGYMTPYLKSKQSFFYLLLADTNLYLYIIYIFLKIGTGLNPSSCFQETQSCRGVCMRAMFKPPCKQYFLSRSQEMVSEELTIKLDDTDDSHVCSSQFWFKLRVFLLLSASVKVSTTTGLVLERRGGDAFFFFLRCIYSCM